MTAKKAEAPAPQACSAVDDPHRRLNPLTGEWVLVSPHRGQRPWLGQVESLPDAPIPRYAADCYLCPTNARANGQLNPDYQGVHVFDNDFPALLPRPRAVAHEDAHHDAPAWMERRTEHGVCRVICYSPRHDLHLAALPLRQVRAVVQTWAEQWRALMARPEIGYVQIFENRGEGMGCSNPHPHGQLWATGQPPNAVAAEDRRQAAYLEARDRCLLCEVAAHELAQGERVVAEHRHWLLIVPYWAVWPFEVLALPRRHVPTLDALSAAERDDLARAWQLLLRRYDGLFDTPMPLSCGWHGRPRGSAAPAAWHLHAHFMPPLLRSASVRKFMVGYEMLAGPQRDLTPEQAAARLREVAG